MYLTQITIYCSIFVTLIHGYKIIHTSGNPEIQLRHRHLDSPTQTVNRLHDIEPDKSHLEDLPEPINVFNNIARDETQTIRGNNAKPSNTQIFRNNLKTFQEVERSGIHSNGRNVGSEKADVFYGSPEDTEENVADIGDNVRSIKLNRRKRGFRSAVVDRIAHGFGKRGALLTPNGTPNIFTASDLEALRKALSQSSYQIRKPLFTLQSKEFQEGDTLTDELLQNFLERNRYQPISDQDRNGNTLESIYKSYLQNPLRGSTGAVLLDNVYDQTDDLN